MPSPPAVHEPSPRLLPARVILEITPPRLARIEVLQRRAGLLGPGQPRVVNVISRPDRWSSLDAAIALRADGFDSVWHLTTRGRGLLEIEREIERAAGAGVRRVLCLRGERLGADDHPGDPKIRDVVARVRARMPGASVGVSLNHHLRDPGVLPNLFRKLGAGADFVQTQVTFELRRLHSIGASIGRHHPGVALIPMLLPVLSSEAARAAARRLGIPLDQALHRDLERCGESAGWRALAERLREIRESPVFATAALMTPIDPSHDYAARLRSIVADAERQAGSGRDFALGEPRCEVQ